MSRLSISLIIPAHNEEAYIGACLDSVEKYAAGKFEEIIVVDNASTDRTADIARSYRGVRVVHESQKSPTCARQRGYQESTSELLALTDADCRMPAEWFGAVERLVREHPEALLWTGSIRYFDGPRRYRLLMRFFWRSIVPATYRIVGYVGVTGNCVVKRSAIDAIGGLDCTIPFHGDDTDLARRVSRMGKVVFRTDFYMYSSMRRFMREGFFYTNVLYALNYVWVAVRGRPLLTAYRDVR